MKNRKTIMVCGHYASGRSKLIQAVCKEGLVPDDAIHPKSIEEEARIGLYETEAVNFVDAQGIQLGELPPDYWGNIEETGQNYSPVDCIWYCIDGAKTSIQEGDQEILDICDENVIVVITRSDLMTEEMIDTFFTNLPNYFRPEQIVITSSKNKLGLNKLLEISKEIVFEDFGDKTPFTQADYLQWDKYFAHQKDWIENAGEAAETCINIKTAKAVAILTSIPIPDKNDLTASMIENNLHMFQQIGACYGYATDYCFCLFFTGLLNGTDKESSLKEKLSIPIITYSYGCAVKAYLESDLALEPKELNEIFDASKEKYKKIDWKNQPMGE